MALGSTQPLTGPEGSRRLRLRDFKIIGIGSSALGAFTLEEIFLVLIAVKS